MLNNLNKQNEATSYQLGDLFSVSPDNYQTLRALVKFEEPINDLTLFYLLGNFKLILTENQHNKKEYDIYLPVGTLQSAIGSRVIMEGKTAFWSAHLPAVQDGMGEIFYRLLDVPGVLDPYIVIYRGPEVLIFIKTHGIPKSALYTQTMPRRVEPDNITITRHAVTVQPLSTSPAVTSKELVGAE